jgi:hypothetical protein
MEEPMKIIRRNITIEDDLWREAVAYCRGCRPQKDFSQLVSELLDFELKRRAQAPIGFSVIAAPSDERKKKAPKARRPKGLALTTGGRIRTP